VIYRTRGSIETQPRIRQHQRWPQLSARLPDSPARHRRDHPAHLTSCLAAKAVTVARAGAHPVRP